MGGALLACVELGTARAQGACGDTEEEVANYLFVLMNTDGTVTSYPSGQVSEVNGVHRIHTGNGGSQVYYDQIFIIAPNGSLSGFHWRHTPMNMTDGTQTIYQITDNSAWEDHHHFTVTLPDGTLFDPTIMNDNPPVPAV